MVASCDTHEDAHAFALVNDSASKAKPLIPLSSNAQVTDLYWDGSDETLRGYVEELQSTITIRAPHLHTLATESVIHDNGRVIIFCSFLAEMPPDIAILSLLLCLL